MFDLRVLTSVLLVVASVQGICPEQSRVCEGGSLQLSCGSGKVITILEANYGRTAGAEVCPHSSIHDLDCHASNSLNIVRAQCDGKSSCAVSATNGVFGDPCGGTYKYLEVAYDCVEHSRVCEGSSLQLSCGSGKSIIILEANYGRTAGAEVCPHSSIRDLDCHASNSLATLKAQCDGRSSCAVSATNGVFGDPCYGTYKYLEVSYDCVEHSRVCEGSSLQLSCGSGRSINILEANYGRTAGSDVCPHPSIHDLDCHASNSLAILTTQCDGRSSCAVSATNGVFGDPCHGTYKYLEVSYDCCARSVEHSRVCEGGSLQLSCGRGRRISILRANYGRTTGAEVCPHSSIRDLDCHASNSLDIVRAQCDGRSSCAVSATNGVFGDPCGGTYKYLEVTYDCN